MLIEIGFNSHSCLLIQPMSIATNVPMLFEGCTDHVNIHQLVQMSIALIEVQHCTNKILHNKLYCETWQFMWVRAERVWRIWHRWSMCKLKQSSWLVDESRWRLRSDDSSIYLSTSTKHRESDYSLLIKLPYWNIGHNLYPANQLSVLAKRLHTLGETTPYEQGIGQNDRKSEAKNNKTFFFLSFILC